MLVAVEDFLRCLYTGKIQDGTNAMELFALAAKYNVQKMKSIFERAILHKVGEDNALEVLNLANLYNSEKLKEKVFEHIKRKFPEVVLSKDLKNQPEVVKKLIEGKRKIKLKNQPEIVKKRINCLQNYKRKIQDVKQSRDLEIHEETQQHA